MHSPQRSSALGHGVGPEVEPEAKYFGQLPHAVVGGLRIVALDRQQTAELMTATALQRRGQGGRTLLLSSANGEVLSKCATDAHVSELFAEADLLNADGQPLVVASRLFCRTPLPERVATTDLFHDVAKLAVQRKLTFYMYGATDDENQRAVARAEQMHPGLKIIGRSHGFLTGTALERKIDEINHLKPDIMWIALGVPREQEFCRQYADRLGNVGMIKTSGGLFNFLSGTRKRAPDWMQAYGLEWLYRIKEEPRRLFWRYAVTNPHALLLLARRSA
jgi:N-acetylglucosaminyldiphosphoundecaprenol N-acetyl-beta-D-mannosaminyltransferase